VLQVSAHDCVMHRGWPQVVILSGSVGLVWSVHVVVGTGRTGHFRAPARGADCVMSYGCVCLGSIAFTHDATLTQW